MPSDARRARSQAEHATINAREYPGTRQLCVVCGEPTERCEEDAIYTETDHGPLCADCLVREQEGLPMPSDALREAVKAALPCRGAGSLMCGYGAHGIDCPAHHGSAVLVAIAPLFEALERDRERLRGQVRNLRLNNRQVNAALRWRHSALIVANLKLGSMQPEDREVVKLIRGLKAQLRAARATEADDAS